MKRSSGKKHPGTSRYFNHVELGDGTSLLFNGATLCMDLVPADYAERIAGGKDLGFLTAEEIGHLLRRGHLTDLPPALELEEFRKMVSAITARISKADTRQKRINLSFILTYDCNLSCRYCYQNSLPKEVKHAFMTGKFVDEFFTEIFPQLYANKTRHHGLTLFGGEPLLPENREAIEKILAWSKKLKSCSINVATNASTLPDMIDLIGPDKGKIQSVQVTLDGDQLLHDQQRIPRSGKPTFEKTVAALRMLIDRKAEIGLRTHIHPGKLESARSLTGYLKNEGLLGHPLVTFYFSPINTFMSEDMPPEERELFFRIFQDVAAETGRPPSSFVFMNKFLKMQTRKILPVIRYCGLGSDTFHLVDPFGDIYQCYEDSGHRERRVGSFAKGKLRHYALKEKYAKRHLLNLPECMKCSMALFCGGGCPVHARNAKGSIFKSHCHLNREFISQTLKAFYLQRTRMAAQA